MSVGNSAAIVNRAMSTPVDNDEVVYFMDSLCHGPQEGFGARGDNGAILYGMSLEGLDHHHKGQYEHVPTVENITEEKEWHDTYEPQKNIYVEVTARAFEPEGETLAPEERAMIFIPGWLFTAKDKSIEGLCRSYAKKLGCRVYAVSTESADCRKDGTAVDLLLEEARGIAAFVRERGVREVFIAGHSRGGNEAIHLAALLEKEKGIRVEGLLPLNSAGLFAQDTDAVGLNLASAIPSEMTSNALRGFFDPKEAERQMQFASDMASNLWSTMLRFNVSYPFRLKDEADEANAPNPHMRDIRAPVVLLFGKQDKVSVMHGTREKLKELFPQAASVRSVVVDAGHMWLFEEPAEASRRTLDALGIVSS